MPAATGTSDRSGLRRQYSRPLMTVLGVVALVLLVACVNVANLFLARATARRHEMSVRLALGATRWRLGRQLLMESLVVALIGAAGGLLFATWASRAVVAGLSTVDTRVSLDLSLDWRVMTVTAGIAVATAMLFGMGPAVRATRAAPIEAIKEQGRVGGTRGDLSSGLVVCQVAVSLVLLVSASLFLDLQASGRVAVGIRSRSRDSSSTSIPVAPTSILRHASTIFVSWLQLFRLFRESAARRAR